MSDYVLRMVFLVAVLAMLYLVLLWVRKRFAVSVAADSDTLKVVDRLRFDFNSELLVIEHLGKKYLVISNQGNFTQLHESSEPKFSKLVDR